MKQTSPVKEAAQADDPAAPATTPSSPEHGAEPNAAAPKVEGSSEGETKPPLSTGAPKIAQAAPPTHAELIEAWEEVTKKRARLIELEEKEQIAADNHKQAKKAVEVCQEELNALIDEHNRPDPQNIFRAAEKDKREADANKGAPAEQESEKPAETDRDDMQAALDAEDGKGADGKPKGDPNGWRNVAITELLDYGMPRRALEPLANEGIVTIGGWADANGKERARVRGLGEVTQDQLERALDKFWAKHPENAAGGKGGAP